MLVVLVHFLHALFKLYSGESVYSRHFFAFSTTDTLFQV